MQFGLKVGIRYLKSKKSSSFLSLITGFSIGGILIGVLTLIVTLSVMMGFENELKERLYTAETHIIIQGQEQGNYFKRDPALLSLIKSSHPQIKDVFESLETEVIVKTGNRVAGAVLKGVSNNYLQRLSSFTVEKTDEKTDPRFPEHLHVSVGQELAFTLGLAAGDRMTAVSPVPSDGPLGVVPRTKQFLVAAVYKSGIPEQEMHSIFLPVEGVESFLGQTDILSKIELRIANLDIADSVARDLKKVLPSHGVRTWQELNGHLFYSLKLERAAMFCILLFIVIVASFNIISTLTMMVTEKKRSISILRAMGATPDQIASIFRFEGLIIGFIGITTGLVAALGICFLLSKYQFIELPAFYYDRSLPVVIDPVAIAVIVISAFVVVYAASVVPSKKASRVTPMEGIRESR